MKLTVYENKKLLTEASEKPKAIPGYAVFHVKACGVCGSDLPRMLENKAYHYPIVVGHEFAGVVEDSTNPALVGKRAAVFPILPCGKCEFCAREEYANCVSYNYYGSRCDGGMQDYLLIKEENLVFLPDSVSFEAGAMTEPLAVCLHAVKKADIRKDTRVLVYGAGTIGMLCAMWAKHFGATTVQVCDIDDNKLDMARELGFEIDDGSLVPDLVIEASGAGPAILGAIERLAAFGTLLMVGNVHKDVQIPEALYGKILRKQLTLKGSWNSDYKKNCNDWAESVAAIAEGQIAPTRLITHRFSLAQTEELLTLIDSRREFFQKIMLEETK